MIDNKKGKINKDKKRCIRKDFLVEIKEVSDKYRDIPYNWEEDDK
ncbi:hypothetical protein MBGDC06_00346 [Thermoplasmatales archaeon SCGC AB-539-C06]|nr:hypothetical protein MBGDC06_00346 [Thermoplasmatales archaeon SCGC AB-539-C06]